VYAKKKERKETDKQNISRTEGAVWTDALP